MRKELRETEIIEKYLQKELSEKEMKEMEEYIKENPDFAQKVEWQKISTESIAKAKLMSKIKKAQKRYKMTKALKLAALIAGIVALGVASYMTYESYSKKGTKNRAKVNLDDGVNAFVSKSENVIGELEVQKFKIQTDKDTVIAGEDGTTIFIPEGAFETEEKEIDFILQEAIKPADIMKAGLETYSDSNLLETGGMFMTEAYDSKGKIELNDSAELTVDVPQHELKEGMKLYDGVKTKDGINWINPKPLEVPLLSVDMSELNFYPPRYEKGLAINGLPLDKDYKDSLYFSFPLSSVNSFKNQENSYFEEYDECPDLSDEFRLTLLQMIDPLGNNYSRNEQIKSCRVGYRYNWPQTELKLPYEKLQSYRYEFPSYTIIHVVGHSDNLDMKVVCSSDLIDKLSKKQTTEEMKFSAKIDGNLDFWGICKKSPPFIEVRLKEKDKSIFEQYMIMNFSVRKRLNGNGVFTMVTDTMASSETLYNSCSHPQLPSTSIQAIWNDRFNNTNLATKAFEERVKYIHFEGMESILDVYVQNINKPLWYSDSIAMNMAAKNPEKFRAFYQERKGQVSLKSSAKGLNKYYKKQRESLANANQTAFKKIEKKYKDLVEKQNKLKSSIEQEELKKEAMALKDEFETNLCETAQRLGYPCKFTIKRSLRAVRGTVTSTGWKNIDRQVMEATLARESATITDPKTGKSAPLRYGMASISLSDMDNYDDIKAYLIPKGTSAYIKMDKKDGGFQKSLSEHMSYKLMVTAYKEGQTYMYTDSLKWKQNLKVGLDKVEEEEINAVVLFASSDKKMEQALIKQMTVISKLSNEKKAAQRKLLSVKEIHRKMRPYIFESCDKNDVETLLDMTDEESPFP
jgi:hypothetical protein